MDKDKTQYKYDIGERNKPSLPRRRRPSPTIEFSLEPEFLGIIAEVGEIFLEHILD